MSKLSATPILEVAWGKTFAAPPLERGASGSWAENVGWSTAAAGVGFTGDFFVGVDWTPRSSTWNPAANVCLISKYEYNGVNERQAALMLKPSGEVILRWSTDGVTFVDMVSTIPTPFSGTQRGCIGASLTVNDGAGNRVGQFYYSYDGRRWYLYETITTAGTTSVYNGAARLRVGILGHTDPAGTLDVFHEAWLTAASPVTFSLLANPHFHDSAEFPGPPYWDDLENEWSFIGDAKVDATGLQLASAPTDRIYTPHTADLAIGGDVSIAFIGRVYSASGFARLVGKYAGGADGEYMLSFSGSGYSSLFLEWVDASGTGKSSPIFSHGFVAGQPFAVAVALDVDTGTGSHRIRWYRSFDGGLTWVLAATNTVGGATSMKTTGEVLAIAAESDGGGGAANIDCYEVQVWNGVRDFAAGTGGTLVANPIPSEWSPSDGADAQGNVWERSGGVWISGDWRRVDGRALSGYFQKGRMRLTDILEAGEAQFLLDNQDRALEPGYTSGPYGSNVVPGVPIRVRVHYDAQARSRWTGFVDRWEADYGLAGERSTVLATCTDAFRTMARHLVSGVEAEIAADSPVGWWKLDETSGTTATDSGSAGDDGTYSGSPLPTLGQLGPRGLRATEYDNTPSNYVELGTGTGITTAGPWSVELWMRPDDDDTATRLRAIHFGATGSNTDMAIMQNGGQHASAPYEIAMRMVRDAGTDYYLVDAAPGAGWHHVVATGIDESGTVAFEAYSEGSSSTGTSHTINLPSAPAGSTVIVTISSLANGSYSWPAGWTEIVDYANSTPGGAAIAYQTFSGSVPSSIIVTSSASDAPNYVCAAYSGVSSVETGVATGSGGTNIDPPSKAASGTPAYWVAVGAGRDTGGPGGTTPAGYSLVKYRQGATLYNAIYHKTGASSTENPGAMTTSGFQAWAAATIALFASSGSSEVKVYVDGKLKVTWSDFNSAASSGEMNIRIGYGWDGHLSQVALYDKRLGAGRIAAHYTAAIGDLPEEDYSQRIARLVALGGLSFDLAIDPAYFDPLTEFDGINLPPTPILELLRQAADSEGGAVFMDEEGRLRGRGFTTRSTYETVSLWTIGEGVGRRGRISTDDDNHYNRVLIGVAKTGELVAAEDVALIASDGLRALDLGDLDLALDDATELAEAVLADFKVPTRRVSSVSVVPERDPATLWPVIRDHQYGERITINFSPPGGGSAISGDFHIEHVSVRIEPDWWEETYELVPA